VEESGRTRVCSVLFIDIVDYSRRDVAEQVRLKNMFNLVMTSALGHVEPEERVVVDTGDGAAVTFLGDPERALYVGLEVFDNVGELPVRMGINLGPVSLMKDLNGLDNVIGDGINVAQRIMSFAGNGELMVSRQFYDIVSRLSDDYAAMFKAEGSRTDKHDRAYDVYSVSKAVRVGRRVAGDQLKLKKKRRGGPDTTFSGMDRTPAQVFDVGTHLLVSGYSEQSVKEAVQKLLDKGGKQIGVASHVGSKWMANVSNPATAIEAEVEALGFTHMITGKTREAVELKLRDLIERGARLVQEPELADGVWTAVCEKV